MTFSSDRATALFALALCVLIPVSAVNAQASSGATQRVAQMTPPAGATGRIVGRVIDAASGQGLTDVIVAIDGTRLGAQTGVDGRYVIPGAPTGAVKLLVKRLGYQAKNIDSVIVPSGGAVEQNIALDITTVELEAVSVTAAAERGSVAEALDAQRTALNVVNSVTQEEISRSADSDAAQAVQRVSAVTLKDGQHVLVRGLDPRYSTTELNGARVPSPEPEKRMVPLDLFPSGLIQSITTAKTFSPDLQGDFAGAVVSIRTREFPAQRTWAAALTGGYATGTTGERTIAGSSVGGEALAMAAGDRRLPALIRDVGNLQGVSLSQSDKNLLVSQFRNSWTPSAATALPNGSGSFSFGGSDEVLSQRIGYLFSATYSQSRDRKENQIRAVANRGATAGETDEADRFEGESSTQSVLLGGLANLSTMIGSNTRLSFNGLYNRSADNSARIEDGSFENEGIDARITRLQYVQRTVSSAQLVGEHEGLRQRLEWAATFSGVQRNEPDRSEFVQAIEQTSSGANVYRWLSSGTGGAVRTFSLLDENAREFATNYTFRFGGHGTRHAVKAGALARITDRDADNRAFSLNAPLAPLSVRELPAEQLFDGRFTGPTDSLFDIRALAQGGSYDANDRITAGYVMAEFAIGDRYRLTGGARYESDRLELNATSTLGGAVNVQKTWNDLLPALGLTMQLNHTQQLRLALSRTLARPEYRELAPISTREVLNGDNQQGNEDLQRTNITNADLRWEWYPNPTELLSIGVFAKQFDNPIERVYRSVSGSRLVFFTNADRADNYGVEIEMRRGLGFLSDRFERLGVFSNLTLMRSQIVLDPNTQASATNFERRMVGQAPYVVNAGLTYMSYEGGTSATLLFNRIGERIEAAGDAPLPDVVETPRNALDFSLRHALSPTVSLRADAKNLLDSPYQVEQGTVIRSSYKAGRTVQLGFQWKAR